MKKRFLSLLLVVGVLATLITVMPITAFSASDGTCGENLTWTLDDTGTLTISGTGEMKNYDDMTNFHPWYWNFRYDIKKINIKEGVTSIGDHAFSHCYDLTEITIPKSVTSIGDSAFSVCSGLTDITIPEGVTSIGDSAFYYCSGLTDINVDNNNNTYASVDGVLYDISKTRLIFYPAGRAGQYTIPTGTTHIGDYAFADCYDLTGITIPKSVTSIGNFSFYYCSGLTDITIPENVTSIGNAAFAYTNLTDINVDNNNNTYASVDGVLYDISKTRLIFYPAGRAGQYTIPTGTTHIGDYAFYDCTGLTDITIQEGVTGIGDYAFSGCTGLTDITIPKSVKIVGDHAFYDCTDLTDITVQEGVTSIGDYMFANCTGLTKVTIPKSVTKIGDSAFYDCSGLTDITMQEGVTGIGDYAFSYCSGLTEITIPKSVTSIGNFSFYYCTGLTDITMQEGVTGIGYYAFSGCSGLTDITIPKSVTKIGDSAFSGCSGLTDITMQEGVTSIGDYAFYACSGLTEITIPKSVTSIGDHAFTDCSGLTDITIQEGVTSIGDYMFANCTGLTKVTIPKSVASIGDYAFSDCSGLTDITIPKSVTKIGNSAFFGCVNLQDVYYDGSAKRLAAIKIGWNNDNLINANKHCTSDPADIQSAICLYDNGKVTAKIRFYDLSQDGVLIAAIYDEGRLVTLKNIPVTADTLHYTFEFNIDESFKSYDVMVLCWDNTESLKPFSETYKTVITEGEFIDKVLESAHPYVYETDETKTYTYDGECESIDVTFSEDTSLAEGFAYIYIYDGNDELIGEYTGNALSGTTVRIPGNTVKIQLVNNFLYEDYGYRTESIVVNK